MEEEFNIKPYIEALIQSWKWIIGAAILAASIAFIGTSLLPPTYQATALAAVMSPREIVQFDPRIQSVDEEQPLKAYPELATSDELLSELLTKVAPITEDIATIETLNKLLSTKAGADPSLLRLTVTYHDPQKTAAIANMWAETFVTKTNEIYGDQGGDQLRFFEEQLETAERDLELAEQVLIEFQAQNRSKILKNELQALEDTQADYLEKQRQIELLLQDVQGLQDQLNNSSSNDAVTMANQLAALLLQIRAFGGTTNQQTGTPWQVQINTEQMIDTNRNDQLAFLNNLAQAITTQSQQINKRLSESEPQILVVQQEKEKAEIEEARLIRDKSVATETYTTLANKVAEESITSQDMTAGVRLASQATVPHVPTGPRRFINTLVAAILGLVIACLGVFIISWWR